MRLEQEGEQDSRDCCHTGELWGEGSVTFHFYTLPYLRLWSNSEHMSSWYSLPAECAMYLIMYKSTRYHLL